jgi:predicted RNase H-like HicB family nuclease
MAGGDKAMKLRIALYPSAEGFAVCVPSLPGCWSQGATEEEALANIAIAVREYLDAEVEPTEGAEFREIEVAV